MRTDQQRPDAFAEVLPGALESHDDISDWSNEKNGPKPSANFPPLPTSVPVSGSYPGWPSEGDTAVTSGSRYAHKGPMGSIESLDSTDSKPYPPDVLQILGDMQDKQARHETRVEAALEHIKDTLTLLWPAPVLDLQKQQQFAQSNTLKTSKSQKSYAKNDCGCPVTPHAMSAKEATSRYLQMNKGFLSVGVEDMVRCARNGDLKDVVRRVGRNLGSVSHPEQIGQTTNPGWAVAVAMLLHSKCAEYTISFLILANSIFLGVEADWAVSNLSKDATPVDLRVFQLFFTVIFAMELFFRVAYAGRKFLSVFNKEFKWNLLDTFLVISSTVDEVMLFVASDAMETETSSVRIIRILRVVKALRIVRVLRFFKDLRIMLKGIASSLKSLCWAVLLLVLLMYLVAIVVLSFVTSSLANSSDDNLKNLYGSMALSIYTLFCSISGGIDWRDAAAPLIRIDGFLGFVFVAYITFALFCVLNIVTGVFVENANKITQKDEDMMIMDELSKRERRNQLVKEIFEETDQDGSGVVTWEEFVPLCQDIRIQTYFQELGIEVQKESLVGLFNLLDFDNDGEIHYEEFALGINQLHGTARSIEIARLKHDVKNILRQLQSLESCLQSIMAIARPPPLSKANEM